MGRQDMQGPQMERMWKNSSSEGGQKAPTKRRKRKASSVASENNSKLGNTGGAERVAKRKSSTPTGRGPVASDVMLVGEPTLMGGEFGAEDERIITRLENTQYVTTNGIKEEEGSFHGSPMPTAISSAPNWSSESRPVIKEEKIAD